MPVPDAASGGPPRRPAQLVLPLRLDDHALFSTLVSGPNRAVIAHAEALASGEKGDSLWLWGPPGVGKSHLLQAACRAADAAGRRSMYVPLAGRERDSAATALTPDVLAGLDTLDVLAIDDIERAAADAAWERALFDVLNTFHADGKALLMGASVAPAAAGFELCDLASRAAGAIVYRVQALDDEDQIDALTRHAKRRGLELDIAAARYLQARVTRDMPALCDWLHRLDIASLSARRRITIPFIRDWLEAERGSA